MSHPEFERKRAASPRLLIAGCLLLLLAASGAAQQAPAPTPGKGAVATASPAEKPKVRAITAFINLDRENYKQQVAEALKTLKYAKTVFESRGYEVQTIRISTQPFPQYAEGLTTEQAVAFFKEYDALAAKEGFDASIGPAMLNAGSPGSEADLLAKVLRNTKILNASVVVAGEDGVRWPAVGAAARVMKKLSETTEHSLGNFRFSAIAMVPPLAPFYPGSYHTGFGRQFAIALQSANVVAEAFRDAPDLAAAKQRLADVLGRHAFAVQFLAERVDRDTGWSYVGIDLSPAPLKDVSIGAAIENLIAQPFGTSGTMTAAATITAAIKEIGVKQTGYSGLMLPILEDSRLAQRWSEGRISLDALLAYSAVCGTGLDTIPLPGDIAEEQLSLIIGDMASLASKWHKPLSARLLPVAGKGAGERSEFEDPFLVNAIIQPLDRSGTKP
jgi:uncharacterized protein (UPF0210 family)